MGKSPVLAIDPGPTQSAWVLIRQDGRLVHFGKATNREVKLKIMAEVGLGMTPYLVIEKVASYGMPVGAEVFETVFWSGRFAECWENRSDTESHRLTRAEVKMHLCHTMKGVNDAVIRQALIDRYGPGKDAAVGTKKKPGPLYGVTKDVWAALAVAVTFQDTIGKGEQ